MYIGLHTIQYNTIQTNIGLLYTSLKFDCANSSAEYIIDLHGNGPPTKYSRMMESRLVILVDYQRVSAGCYGCDTDTFAFIDHSARANCVSQRRIWLTRCDMYINAFTGCGCRMCTCGGCWYEQTICPDHAGINNWFIRVITGGSVSTLCLKKPAINTT